MKKTLLIAISIVVLLLIAVPLLVPPYVEKSHNRLENLSLSKSTNNIMHKYSKMFVADLHADSLLWDRDLSVESGYGHLDLPRMRRGGEALQVFSMVTKTPHGLNLQRNADDSDDITLLAMVQAWPIKSWFSLRERVFHMISRLRALADNKDNYFMLVTSRDELDDFLQKRHQDKQWLAGLLSIEGAHALEADLENIDVFYKQGVRFIGLAHFFDNELGGSAHGEHKDGLTSFGKKAVARMQSLGITIDLAHSSPRAFEDVINMSRKPVIVSHTGVRGTCDKGRNLSDKQIRQVVDKGGLIGIGFWPNATCGHDVESIVKAIDYAVSIAGVEHVGLGSDFDGSVKTPLAVSDLPVLADKLFKKGYSQQQVSMIMGGNLLQFLQKNLPPKE